MKIENISYDQIENWITFLNGCRRNDESKRNRLLNEAFSRDMKPDKELCDLYTGNIDCANELIDFVYEIRRCLRNNKYKVVDEISVRENVIDKWIDIFAGSKANAKKLDECDFLDAMIGFLTESKKDTSDSIRFPTFEDIKR